MKLRVQHRLVINEPVETVFRALTDFEAEPRWQPAVIETKLIPEGPVHLMKRSLTRDVATRFATLKTRLETNHHL